MIKPCHCGYHGPISLEHIFSKNFLELMALTQRAIQGGKCTPVDIWARKSFWEGRLWGSWALINHLFLSLAGRGPSPERTVSGHINQRLLGNEERCFCCSIIRVLVLSPSAHLPIQQWYLATKASLLVPWKISKIMSCLRHYYESTLMINFPKCAEWIFKLSVPLLSPIPGLHSKLTPCPTFSIYHKCKNG